MAPEGPLSCLDSLWPNVRRLCRYGKCYCLVWWGLLVSGPVHTVGVAADWLVCSGFLPLLVPAYERSFFAPVAERGMSSERLVLVGFLGSVVEAQRLGA